MSYSKYHQAITEEMNKLAKDPKVLFLGQQVGCQDFYGTLTGVPKDKRVEMPIAEEMQLGLCIGLAMEGYLPVCVYQRMDFLPRAADQIFNHLDKIKEMSGGIFSPKVIIRTTIGTKKPLDVGTQHSQDLTQWLQTGLDNVWVFHLENEADVGREYQKAVKARNSSILVERQELYYE